VAITSTKIFLFIYGDCYLTFWSSFL